MNSDELKIKHIIEALNSNHISFDKSFKDLIDVPYPFEDYEKLSLSIINDMEQIVSYGTNYGFSLQAKKAIKNLTKMVAELSKKTKRNQIENFRNERKEIMGNLNLESKTYGLEIKKPVIDLLNDTIIGLEVLENRNRSERFTEICKSLSATLSDAKEKVNGSFDNYSIEAMKKCNTIVQEAMHLRKMVGRMIVTSAESKQIEEKIKNASIEWFNLKDSKKKKAKKDHFSKISYLGNTISISDLDFSHFEDNFYIVTKSQEFREKFDILNEQIEDFKKKSAQVNNQDSTREKILEAEKEANNHISNIKALGAKVQAKQIPEKEAIIIATREDKLVKEYQKTIKRLQTDLTYQETTRLSREKIVSSLDDVVSKIKQNENNDVVEYLYFKNLDLESIGSLLSGNGSPEECEKAIQSLVTGIEISHKQEIKFRELSIQTEKAFDESYDALYKELDRLDMEALKDDGEQLENEEEIHSSLSSIFGQYGTEINEEDEKEENKEDNFNDLFGNY